MFAVTLSLAALPVQAGKAINVPIETLIDQVVKANKVRKQNARHAGCGAVALSSHGAAALCQRVMRYLPYN